MSRPARRSVDPTTTSGGTLAARCHEPTNRHDQRASCTTRNAASAASSARNVPSASVVAMPVVLLLYIWWKRGKVTVRDLVRAVPFFLISIVLGLVTIYYQHGRAIGQETIIVPPYFANGLPSIKGILSRLAVAGMSTLFYLSMIFWPLNLLPIYTRWEIDPPKVWQLLPIPVILGAAWWLWQNRTTWGRNVIFGLGFFVLMVAPVLGFITISYMRITWAADHFIYLPMIGLIALIAAAVAAWYDRLPSGERPMLGERPSASDPVLAPPWSPRERT
jgi:hypothetical protein